MRVALYGKGITRDKALEYLKGGSSGVEPVALVSDVLGSGDNAICLSEAKTDCGIEVYELGRLAEEYSAGNIDAVIIAMDNSWIGQAVLRLLSRNIIRICIVPYMYEYEDAVIDDQAFMWVDPTKPRLEYLELHLADQCNLNCKGCAHFSNIVREERYADIKDYCRDLTRLQELFWGIGKLRLLGGEPLLNPALPEFVEASREAFPDADIRVVSNGLLLREDMTELLESMHRNRVGFDISLYPPTSHLMGKIAGICRNAGVKLFATPPVEEFYAGLVADGSSDPAAAYRNCPARHCTFLGNGVISACARPQLIHYYLEEYPGYDMKYDPADVIDLYEEGMDGVDLLNRLHRPMDSCRYCSEKNRMFAWEAAKWDRAKAEDWFS